MESQVEKKVENDMETRVIHRDCYIIGLGLE